MRTGKEPKSGYANRLRPDKLRFQMRFAIFEQHRHDLGKILLELFHAYALTVCPAKSRHVSDVQPSLGIAFDYGSIRLQSDLLRRDYWNLEARTSLRETSNAQIHLQGSPNVAVMSVRRPGRFDRCNSMLDGRRQPDAERARVRLAGSYRLPQWVGGSTAGAKGGAFAS